MFDPHRPDDPNKYLMLDFKSGTKSCCGVCAHCLNSISHEWPGKDEIGPSNENGPRCAI